MQELSAAANVSVVVGVLIGLILGLAWSVPKLAKMFRGSEDRSKRPSDRPRPADDNCEDCRGEVHDLCLKFAEHRAEEKEAKSQLSRVLGEVRDLLRDYLTEQRALRQTGDGIRIPRIGGGGST